MDGHKANEVRPVMKHIGMLAEKHNCAIVLIEHMSKNVGTKGLYRGLGSIDTTAAANIDRAQRSESRRKLNTFSI